MRKTVLAAACATALLGCKEHSKDTTVVPASKRDATAATNGSGVAESPIASKYKTCWASFNAAKWDELRACYAPGASIDPGTDGRQSLDVDAKLDAEKKARLAVPARHAEVELVIVADTTIIGVLQMTGGTSFYVVDVVEYDEHGRIKTEDIYRDGLGVSRPLPPGLVGGTPSLPALAPRPNSTTRMSSTNSSTAWGAAQNLLSNGYRRISCGPNAGSPATCRDRHSSCS